MQNLDVFFINHFDTDRISDDNIAKFSEDHLMRLSENGLYPGLSAALLGVHQAYFGAITDEATKTAVREGQTKAVDNAVKAIKDQISQHEGTVRGKYGKESPTYQEFFPQGVSEYRQATLANIDEKVTRFINATIAHKADLPALDTQFTDLRATFRDARDAQLGTKGAVGTSKTTSSTTRDEVEKQLMVNLLTIALDNIGKPNAGLAYFDQSILNRPAKSKAPAAPSARQGVSATV